MKVDVISKKIVCDCCKETFRDGDDFVCYSDDPDGSLIESEATNSDWMKLGDKHYCPNCWKRDDDDYIVTKDGHKYDEETDKEVTV